MGVQDSLFRKFHFFVDCKYSTNKWNIAASGLQQGAIRAEDLADCVVIAVPDRDSAQDPMDTVARWLLQHFIGRCWLGVTQLRRLDDEMLLHKLR